MACTSANVSFSEQLTAEELAAALLSGAVPHGRAPHLRVVFDELPPAVFDGLLRQLGEQCDTAKLHATTQALADAIGSKQRGPRGGLE